MTIPEYLNLVKERLLTEAAITHFEIVRERATAQDGHLRARLIFINGTQMEFSEYFQILSDDTIVIRTYSYHWSSPGGDLIARWDNTPHFPGLEGFPHHIHRAEGNIVLPGKPMNIFSVLDEIVRTIHS